MPVQSYNIYRHKALSRTMFPFQLNWEEDKIVSDSLLKFCDLVEEDDSCLEPTLDPRLIALQTLYRSFKDNLDVEERQKTGF
jgi:hypothetical protein